MTKDELLDIPSESGLWKVNYLLTSESCVPSWSDTSEALGREFQSIVCVWRGEISDYSYPCAKQADGSWLMCGRVVKDWGAVDPLSIAPIEDMAILEE